MVDIDNDKINIADLLKDCPKGTKLYSPLFGEVEFDCIEDGIGIKVDVSNGCTEIFYSNGRFYNGFTDAECLLFLSKDQRDWSKFVPPCKFKDGDIVATTNGLFVGIVEVKNNKPVGAYCSVDYVKDFRINSDYVFDRLATTWEKEKLFKAIKDNGYKWNEETKTLEKLAEPKFKDGDRVVKKGDISTPVSIVRVGDKYYYHYSNTEGTIGLLPISEQDDWELIPTKFDINTLKPFDKVLVRDNNEQFWTCDWFSFHDTKQVYPFACVGHYVSQCIPYEENQHLLGTTDDCDEYFKNWE